MVKTATEQKNLLVNDFTQGGAHTPHQVVVPRYYGDTLLSLAHENENIVCLSADLTSPTETDIFRDTFPKRFINVGIAEANMVGIAGGLARGGMQPWLHTFCSFATRRCYDQVAMQIAYPKLNAKIVGFLPGLSTILGVTHQAIDDIALMRAIPNMTIIEPSGPAQVPAAVRAAAEHNGPVYLRLIRAAFAKPQSTEWEPMTIGQAEQLRKGTDFVLFASGITVSLALQAADLLEAQDFSVSVVNIPSVKPLDIQFIEKNSACHRLVVTIENHSIIGGLGSAVAECLAELDTAAPLLRIGVRDVFSQGASQPYLLDQHGLTPQAIANAIIKRTQP